MNNELRTSVSLAQEGSMSRIELDFLLIRESAGIFGVILSF